MSFYLNIILAIIAIPLIILPFGKLRDKRVKANFGFTINGIIFYVCMVLATGISIWKECLSNQEEGTKEKRNNEVQSKVDTISDKIRSLDSLGQQLDAVHFNTLQAIEERERFLVEFNRMNDKIKSLTENEKQKFESSHPEIIIYEEPFFSVFDSVNLKYSLKFRLINNGSRTADKIEINPIIFVSTDKEIISHLEIGKLRRPTNPTTKISSYEKSKLYTEVFYDEIGFPDNESVERFNNIVFLAIKVQYSDAFTGEKHSNIEYFGWYNFSKNKYTFKRCSNEGFNLIEKYLNKINLKF